VYRLKIDFIFAVENYITDKMKWKRNIAYALMAVCMVMLTAAVFPHHHHLNFICLQYDWATCDQTCETAHHHSLPNQCEDGCVTKFYCSIPSSGIDMLPYFPFITLLYSIADILKLGIPDEPVYELSVTYVESLHSLTVQRKEGLRAPPCA